jgi:glycosyltransferase involved in cell wall biosynthesis
VTKKKIIIKAPVLSRSGYGEQARFALRALRAREDLFDIYLINIKWGNTSQIIETGEERQWIDQRLKETFHYMEENSKKQPPHTLFDLSLQITIPIEFEKMCPINIGYTAGIETSRVAFSWLEKSNQLMDKIITISEHSKSVFENTKYSGKTQDGREFQDYGLQVPIGVVNYPTRQEESEPLEIDFITDKNFLVISQWGIRKNLDNTIAWFVEEFKDDADAGLVVKTNTGGDSMMDRQITEQRLVQLLNNYPDRKCKIYYLHGEVTPQHLAWLYQHPTMKALINIAHGEGYGLPLFEAAYNGLPLVTLSWSGQMDFICKPNKKGKNYPRIVRVAYDIGKVQKEAVWKEVIEEDAMWAYARENSYKRALRDVLEKSAHYAQEATALKNHIIENFTEEKIYKDFVDQVWGVVEASSEDDDNPLLYFERQN